MSGGINGYFAEVTGTALALVDGNGSLARRRHRLRAGCRSGSGHHTRHTLYDRHNGRHRDRRIQ